MKDPIIGREWEEVGKNNIVYIKENGPHIDRRLMLVLMIKT